MLFEAIVTRQTPTGDIRLHVPVVRRAGRWINATTGEAESWVCSVEPMSNGRAAKFEAQWREIMGATS